jgi:hypothetical protein
MFKAPFAAKTRQKTGHFLNIPPAAGRPQINTSEMSTNERFGICSTIAKQPDESELVQALSE